MDASEPVTIPDISSPVIVQRVGRHSLYASETVRNLLTPGFFERLPELAGMDLLLIGPGDVSGKNSEQALKDLVSETPQLLTPLFSDRFNFAGQNILALNAAMGVAGSYKTSYVPDKKIEKLCIVMLSSITGLSDKKLTIAAKLHVDPEAIENTGSLLMQLRLDAGHEAKHCSQVRKRDLGDPLSELSGETDADRATVKLTHQVFGPAADDSISFYELDRAVPVLFDMSLDVGHYTGPGVQWPGQKRAAVDVGNGEDYRKGIKAAKTLIFQTLAAEGAPPQTQEAAIESARLKASCDPQAFLETADRLLKEGAFKTGSGELAVQQYVEGMERHLHARPGAKSDKALAAFPACPSP